MAAIGRPEITFHALRHSHASLLIHSNVPVTVIAARMGHSSPQITLSTYAHLYSNDDAQAAAAIDAALSS